LSRRHGWTVAATGGILPRHACSARCGARRRSPDWPFRSAPCLPSGRLSLRYCALPAGYRLVAACAAPEGLWICGQRNGVAHIPTGRSNNSQPLFDCF
jgi:hypothetical protein